MTFGSDSGPSSVALMTVKCSIYRHQVKIHTLVTQDFSITSGMAFLSAITKSWSTKAVMMLRYVQSVSLDLETNFQCKKSTTYPRSLISLFSL
jgi:hypothetical protein